jgi:hypothetical protein
MSRTYIKRRSFNSNEEDMIAQFLATKEVTVCDTRNIPDTQRTDGYKSRHEINVEECEGLKYEDVYLGMTFIRKGGKDYQDYEITCTEVRISKTKNKTLIYYFDNKRSGLPKCTFHRMLNNGSIVIKTKDMQ